MGFILIITAAVLIGLVSVKKQMTPAVFKMSIGVVAAFGMLLALLHLLRGCHEAPLANRDEVMTFERVMAVRLAEEMALDLTRGGDVLLLHLVEMDGDKMPDFVKQRIAALQEGFGNSGLQLKGVVPDGEERQGGMPTEMMITKTCSEAEFVKILEQHPGVVAVVSAMGVPEISMRNRRSLWPKIYLLGASQEDPGVTGALKTGLVSGAVLYKKASDFTAEISRGMSPEEVFDLRYIYVAGKK